MNRLLANDCQLVADFYVKSFDSTLAGIACSTPSWIATVDIETGVAILQIEISIGIVGNLVDNTSYSVIQL